MQLAAATSNMQASTLESLYLLEASSDDFGSSLLPEEDEEDVENVEHARASESERVFEKNGMREIFSEIQRTAAGEFEEEDEDAEPTAPKAADSDAQLPDGEKLIGLTEAGSKDSEPVDQNIDPIKTLTEVLFLCGPRFKDFFLKQITPDNETIRNTHTHTHTRPITKQYETHTHIYIYILYLGCAFSWSVQGMMVKCGHGFGASHSF